MTTVVDETLLYARPFFFSFFFEETSHVPRIILKYLSDRRHDRRLVPRRFTLKNDIHHGRKIDIRDKERK